MVGISHDMSPTMMVISLSVISVGYISIVGMHCRAHIIVGIVWLYITIYYVLGNGTSSTTPGFSWDSQLFQAQAVDETQGTGASGAVDLGYNQFTRTQCVIWGGKKQKLGCETLVKMGIQHVVYDL